MFRKRTTGRRLAMSATAFALGVGLIGLTAGPASAQEVEDLPWMDTSLSPEERADLLIDAMTLEQKMLQVAMNPHDNNEHGLEDCDYTRIGRHLEGIPELGIPLIRMTNGPSGVGGGDCAVDPTATALPSSIGIASSFDVDNSYRWGDIAGFETRAGAHNVFLAPGINLARLPQAGRNFEYFGEDPYLTGVMGVGQIVGIQENNVHANAKHFAFNEQETGRRTMDTIIPGRAAHELYLLPFEMAVKDGEVASLMCSFPRIEGVYACENPELLTTVLRDQWGFEGYVFSDRNATLSTVESILAGNDLEFPQRNYYSPENLERALDAGEITEEHLDTMLRHRYVQMFKFGLFENPVEDYSPIDFDDHGATSREIGADGIVLLKNEGDVLPIDSGVDSILIVGPEHFAGQAKLGPNSPNINSVVEAPYTVSPVEGLENVLDDIGSDATVEYFQTEDVAEAAEAAADADVVIVMVGDLSVEGQDRPTLHLEDPDTYREGQDGYGVIEINQEELISAVAAANDNTVVVLKNGGAILMPWLDEVPAVVEAFYPGQEDGHIVADVLLGVVNPSGKLPFTFPVTDSEAAFETVSQFPGDVIGEGGEVDPDPDFGDEDNLVRRATYSEDLEMGYRWYEANDVDPTFPFGFGLSYTTFEYSDLEVTPIQTGRAINGLEVEFTVTNTGDVAGAEAAQVYLDLPARADQPSKRLVGFDKPYLEPGESATVSVTIDASASNHPFSYWVPEEGATWADGEWREANGRYIVSVGTSLTDTPLTERIRLRNITTVPGGADEGDIPIRAEVPDTSTQPGSLTLRIEAPGSVDLGTARTQQDRLRFDGDLPPVVVTDSRNNAQASGGGWSVTGRAAPFVSDDDEFSSSYLGWEPWTTADDRPGVTAGPQVHGELRGGPGLVDPATLVSATNAGRRGAATAGAHLLLEVPLDTPPGEYRSSISLSLFAID